MQSPVRQGLDFDSAFRLHFHLCQYGLVQRRFALTERREGRAGSRWEHEITTIYFGLRLDEGERGPRERYEVRLLGLVAFGRNDPYPVLADFFPTHTGDLIASLRDEQECLDKRAEGPGLFQHRPEEGIFVVGQDAGAGTLSRLRPRHAPDDRRPELVILSGIPIERLSQVRKRLISHDEPALIRDLVEHLGHIGTAQLIDADLADARLHQLLKGALDVT